MSSNLLLKNFAFVFLLLASLATSAQERLGSYQIRVVPDRDNWTYELNQPAKFTISVTLDNQQVSGLPLKYSCGLEAMLYQAKILKLVQSKYMTYGCTSSFKNALRKVPFYYR